MDILLICGAVIVSAPLAFFAFRIERLFAGFLFADFGRDRGVVRVERRAALFAVASDAAARTNERELFASCWCDVFLPVTRLCTASSFAPSSIFVTICASPALPFVKPSSMPFTARSGIQTRAYLIGVRSWPTACARSARRAPATDTSPRTRELLRVRADCARRPLRSVSLAVARRRVPA